MADREYHAGDVFVIPYPFIRCTVDVFGENGYETINSWRPGVEWDGGCEYDEPGAFAHGEGSMRLTVVDVFKPGKFPKRVFYTRKFVTPTGHEFGKGSLRMATVEKFARLSAGYHYSYDVEDMLSLVFQGEGE